MSHIGKIIDGRWQIVKRTRRNYYLLHNIFNHQELELEERVVLKGNISRYVARYLIRKEKKYDRRRKKA